MTDTPLALDDFTRLSPTIAATVVDGLSATIDAVADRATGAHRFLRFQWFAAAVDAYGGHPRTILVPAAGIPAFALPTIPFGPRWARLRAVPGCYWPFRSAPIAAGAGDEVAGRALALLATTANGLRIGPVIDGDPAATALLGAARARGWTTIDRTAGANWLLDIGADDWPRGSTLRKNRFHEKHLADHGAIEWQSFGADTDWPRAFAAMAAVERSSWVMTRTDGRDAKFAGTTHARFWSAATADPVLAGLFAGGLLRIDGAPAAFAFDIDAGDRRYAIANGYDPAYARHSPGKLLQYRNLVVARANGIRIVDWGMGDSGYKQTMGAVMGAPLRDWLLLRPGLPALAGRMLARFWARSDQSRP